MESADNEKERENEEDEEEEDEVAKEDDCGGADY